MTARKNAILHCIWKNPSISRKEIATAHRLHPNLVSDAVRELLEEDWVVEGGPKAMGSGRAPMALYLHPEQRAALAVSYNLTGITCALINPRGEVLDEITQPVTPTSPEALVTQLIGALERLRDKYTGHLIGIGVADPGMVDSLNGEIVRSSSFPDWHHVPLAEMLHHHLHLPIILEDVTRARAMAQYMRLPERQAQHGSMLYLDYDEGIGFALVTPDGIWRGEGFAGELGHVVIEPGGPLCRCGASGCIESLASPHALEIKARELLGQGIASQLRQHPSPDIHAIFSAALDSDRLARHLIDAVMGYLGLTVSLLVASMHPRFLVIGAQSAATVQYLTRELSAAIHDRTLPEIASSLQIIEGKETPSLAVIGAGLMVFEHILTRGNGVLQESTV